MAGTRPLARSARLFHGQPVEPVRSYIMSQVGSWNTGPEMAFRKALAAHGARYRVHSRRVPGKPDVANQRARVAVFIDGCFWHGCPVHYKVPRTRQVFWAEKVRRNQERRREVLGAIGPDWTVFEFFECQLKAELPKLSKSVADAILASSDS